MRFTALMHPVCDPDTLREADWGSRRIAALERGGIAWRNENGNLEADAQTLSEHLRCGGN